jgi:hypothetical protein
MTEARKNFDTLICAALREHQIITRRGIPRYVFSPAGASELRKMKAEYGVVVRSLVNKAKR